MILTCLLACLFAVLLARLLACWLGVRSAGFLVSCLLSVLPPETQGADLRGTNPRSPKAHTSSMCFFQGGVADTYRQSLHTYCMSKHWRQQPPPRKSPHKKMFRQARAKPIPHSLFYVVFGSPPPRGTNPYHTRCLHGFRLPQEAQTHTAL